MGRTRGQQTGYRSPAKPRVSGRVSGSIASAPEGVLAFKAYFGAVKSAPRRPGISVERPRLMNPSECGSPNEFGVILFICAAVAVPANLPAWKSTKEIKPLAGLLFL